MTSKYFAMGQIPSWARADAVEGKEETPMVKRYLDAIRRKDFFRRYGLAILGLAAFTLYSVMLCVITGSVVRHNTRMELEQEFTAVYEERYRARIEELENQRTGQQLLTGDASRQAAWKAEAEYGARLLYGIRNFVDKYGYTERDLNTLLRCVFNRVENAKYPSSVQEVIRQKDQWIGYSDTNPVIDGYYRIALAAVEAWHEESTKPCSNDYEWAEFREDGIWLRNKYEADGYQIRWRAEK